MSSLTEIACIRPGAQLWSPSVMAVTQKYFIYASTHQVYVYKRYPTLQYFTMINQGNTIVCAIAADEQRLVVVGNDMKIYLYDMVTFELIRQLLLVRNDAPVSVQFHYHLEHSLLVLFQEDENAMLASELRSIDTQSGGSATLVQGIGQPVQMVCSPHNPEVSILMADGQVRIYGITSGSSVSYERILLTGELQVYETTPYSNQLQNQPSAQSTEIIDIINDFRKAPDVKNTACTGLTYDPKSADYFLVCWSFGLHVLFSSITGQALQLYQPQTTGILSISYSASIVGRFYTTDGTTGIFREWNVSQNQQISETRLSGPILLRSIVGISGNSNQQHDILHFIDRDGKVIVYRPADSCLIYETERNHSEAVLSLDVDEDYFCTGGFDGLTRQWHTNDFHFKADIGRQRSMQFGTVKYSESAVSQTIKKSTSKRIVNQLGASVCCAYAGDVILAAQHDGLIIAFDKVSCRPLANVFLPRQQYHSSLNDQIYEYFQEEPNIIKQKRYQTDFRIRCLLYDDGYVYSGWRDGCIRIMKLTIIKSDKVGVIVSSNFVAQIPVHAILKVQNDKDLQVLTISVCGNILYCGCSAGVFIVMDLTRLKQMCSSINALEFNEQAFQRQANKLFQQGVFVGNLNRVEYGAIIPNMASKTGQIAYLTKFFNALCVSDLSQDEQNFFKGYDDSKPAKLLALADNYGNFLVLAQIGLDPEQMCFKIISVRQEQYQITTEQQMNPRGILGLTSVLRISPFHYAIGGADGVLKIIDYRMGQGNDCVAALYAGKASISCMRLFHNNIIVGSYDGAVRIVSYTAAGVECSNLIATYRELFQSNQDPNQSQGAIIQRRFGKFYLFEELQDILSGENRIFARFGPMSSQSAYQRALVILYSLLSQFLRMTGTNLDTQMEKLGCDVEKVIGRQFLTQVELADYIYRHLGGNYVLYDMGHFDVQDPPIQRLRAFFGLILRLSTVLGYLELLSQLFLQLDMRDSALLTASFVSREYWRQMATELTLRNIISGRQFGCQSTAERYQLHSELRPGLFRDMREISAAVRDEDTGRIESQILSYVAGHEFAMAKILVERAQFLRQRNGLNHRVSLAIANYYASNWQPLFAAYELLCIEDYALAARTLLFCGEHQLLLYVLLRLRVRGFDLGNLVCALLYDQIARFTGESADDVLAAAKMDQPIDDLVGENIPFSEFVAFYKLNFDLEAARRGHDAVRDCKNAELTLQSALDIANYIRYLIACELCGAPVVKHDESQELAPLEVPNTVVQQFMRQFYLYDSTEHKFCRAAAKELNYLFIRTRVTKHNLGLVSVLMAFLARHNAITGAAALPEYGPRKSPLIARLMLYMAAHCARMRQPRMFHIYIGQSAKCIRKFHLEQDAAIQELSAASSEVYDDISTDSNWMVPIGGRSVFEMIEKRINSVFGSIAGDMEWVRSYFE